MKTLFMLIWLLLLTGFPLYAHEETHHHSMAAEERDKTKGKVGICPVMREPASGEYSYTYKDKVYYFCCPMCIEKFKNDPENYTSKIKEVNLQAYQYGFQPDPIKVKKDDIVKLTVTSKDVTHGIYIKEYGINLSVKKGEFQKIEFIADKSGEFDILCSVYCGAGHSKMKGKLVVE